MKKSEGSRSHSWWWDSHISPKNSRWLQENLSEMDSKVTAMLKIIEEDADTFSKRAEMYYKRRPELVNLVEEFYRTYRALVERYTVLTREIRQNVAPALQAQLGVSADSAPNSPLDAHAKHGVDGIDMLSPSYSYTGGSEFDDDSPSEVSCTSWKAHMDEEDYSPQGMGTSFDIRFLSSKSKLLSMEEETFHKVHESGGLPHADDSDIKKLQKDLRHLQEENKALSAKALGDVTNLKNLHLELSSLQSKMRTMEAEDKLAKNRLMSVLEQEQKLEAENLKLSHALITAKEERTGLDELRKREMEESDARGNRIQELEAEAVSLKDEILRAQSQASVALEQVKKLEVENEKLQRAIESAQAEREKDCIDQRQTFELVLQELQERFSLLEKDNVRLKEQIIIGSADTKRLEDQVMELINAKKDLAQELHDLQKQNKALEQEKHRADMRSQKLQWELEVARKNGQSLSEQMVQKTAQIENLQKAICELQAESTRLAIQKMEGSKLVIKLEADIQELQRDRNRLIADCQEYEGKCKAFEMAESQFKEQLASKYLEYAVLQDQKSASEATVAKVELQVKGLQESLSTLYSEKGKLQHELEKALEQVKTIENHCTQMQLEIEESQGCSNKLRQEIAMRTTRITDLEGTLSCLLEEKGAIENREAEAWKSILELQASSSKLREQLGAECAVTKQLKDQISDLQEERTALGLDVRQAKQTVVSLQEEKLTLSNQYEKSCADHQAAVEAVRKCQEDLSLHLCNLKTLQEQHDAKIELIHRMENEIETLRKHLAQSEEGIKMMGKENEDHIKKIVDAEGRISILEAAYSDTLTENAALGDRISDKARAIEVLEARIADLERERDNFMMEVAVKSDFTLLLQQQLLESEQEGKSLHTQLQNGADVIRRLEVEVKRVQEAVSRAEKDNKTLIDDQQRSSQEIFSMNKKIKDLLEELSHVTLEKAAVVGELTNSAEHCKDLELRIQSLKVDKDAVQQELLAAVLLENQLKEDVKILQEENKQLSCTLKSEHEKLQQQEDDFQKLQKTLNFSQEECKVVHDKLNVMSEERNVLERKCGELQLEMHARLFALQKQEEFLHTQLQDRADTIQNLEAELKRLQQAVSKGEEDKGTMVQERQRIMDQNLLMEKKIKNLQEELSHVTQEKVALVGEFTLSTKHCEDLELKIQSLEVDKELQMRNVQKQEEDLEMLQRTLKSSQEKFEALQDKLNAVSEEKNSLERKFGDLQMEMDTQLLDSQKQEESLHTQLHKGANVILSLEAEVKRLQEAICKAEVDHMTMVQERQRSMDESLLMEKKTKDLHEEINHLTQEKAALVGEVTISTKHCKDLELRIQTLEVDKGAAMRMVQEQEEDMEKLQQTLKFSQEEFKTIQGKLNATSEEKNVLERKCGDLQSEMDRQLLASQKQEESLHAQLQKGADVIHSLETELKRLQQEVSKVEEDHKTMVQERQRSMDGSLLMERKIKDLQAELAHLTQEKVTLVGDLELRIQTLEVDKDATMGKVQKQEEDLQMLQQTLKSSQEESKTIQGKLNAAFEKKDALERKYGDLQLEMDTYLLTSRKQEESLHAQLQNGTNVIQSLEAELKRLKQAVSKAEGDHKTMVQEQQRSIDESLLMEKKIKDLQEELSHLTQERVALVAEFAISTKNCKDLELRIQTLEVDKDAAMRKVQTQEGDLQLLQQTLKSSREEFKAIHGKFNAASDERDALKRKCGDLQSEMDTQLLASQKQEESLHAQLEKGSDMIRSLEAELKRLQQALSKAEGDHKTILEEWQRNIDESSLMEKRIKDLEGELGHLTQEKVALVGEFSISSKHCKELELKIQTLEVDKDASMRELQKQQEDLQMLLQTLKSSQEESLAIRDKLNSACKEKDVLEKRCGDMQLEMHTQLLASQKHEEFLHNQLEKGADVIQNLEEELKRLQQVIYKAEGDHRTMVEELQKSVNEGLLMEKRIKDLHDELGHLTQERVALVGEATISAKCCKDLELKVQTLEVDKDAEMRKVQKQDEDLQMLQQTLKCSQEQCKAIRDKLNVAFEARDGLERKCGDLQVDMDAQLLALQKQEESFDTQLQEGADVIHGLDTELQRLNKAVSKAEGNHRTLVQEQQRSIEENLLLGKKIKDLQEEISHLTQVKVALFEEIETSKEQCKDLELRMHTLIVDKDVVEEELLAVVILEKQLKGEMRKIQEENKQLSGTLDTEMTKMQKQQDDLKDLQQALESSQEECKAIQEKLKAATEEKVDLERKHGDLQEELKDSKRAALAAAYCVGQLEANISTKVKAICTLQEDALKLQNENQDFEDKLQMGVQQIKLLEEETERLRQALDDAQRECEGLEEKSRMKEKATEALRMALKDGTNEVNDLKIEVERLRQQSDQASQRCSDLHGEKRKLDDAVESLQSKVNDLQVVIDGLENTKQTLLMELQQHDKHGMQMMLDIKDLRQLLDDRRHITVKPRIVSSANNGAVVSDELQRSRAEQIQMSVPSEHKAVQTSTSLLKVLDSPNESVLPIESIVCSADRESSTGESAVVARKHEIFRLEEQIRNVLEENNALCSESLAAWKEHQLIEVKAIELQGKLSSQERENVRLSSEVQSIKTDVERLEAEATCLKEENGGLHEKVLVADLESRKLQGVLSNLQVEGRRFVISLKVKLFSMQEEVMCVTEEWQNSIGNAEGIHHVVCCIDQANTSDIGVCEEETSRESLDQKSTENWSVGLVLAELQARVEEADKVLAAVTMLRQIAAKFRLVTSGERADPPVREQPDERSVEEKQVLAMVETERSHLTLGTRLHYEEMDEELEKELLELKEGRKKLREELEERAERARRVQAEVEEQLKDEAKQGGAQRRQKVARQVEEQRQLLERMREEWTRAAAVQEPALESLEEQVRVLVDKDEWNEEEEKRLRTEIGRLVQQNRTHALELQSVDEELKRLESQMADASSRDEHEQQPDEDETSMSSSIGSSVGFQEKKTNSGRRRRRFSISWIVSPHSRTPPPLPAPLRTSSSTSSNTTLLLEHLRDRAKCWACVAAAPKHALVVDD